MELRGRIRWALALAGCFLGLAVIAALPLAWESRDRAGADSRLVLDPFVEGLDRPVYLTHAGDGSGDLYVVERAGMVRRVGSGGIVDPVPVLDLRTQVSTAMERGLLSIAFRPGPGPKTDLFAYYVDRMGRITVSRFSFDGVRARGETALARVWHPRKNHVGGQVAFGPDGMLYFATGDGGGGSDPDRNGQDPDTLLAKLLRVDPDATGLSRPEVVGMGLRNPYRFSFDGDTLYLADVGQDRIEEVNVVPTSRLGGEVENFGWSVTEGDECFLDERCHTDGLFEPAITYHHEDGRCSVVGGHVYRGTLMPELAGRYLFGDYCTGEIFGLNEELRAGFGLAAFGLDAGGEVYVINTKAGTIARLVPASAATAGDGMP